MIALLNNIRKHYFNIFEQELAGNKIKAKYEKLARQNRL